MKAIMIFFVLLTGLGVSVKAQGWKLDVFNNSSCHMNLVVVRYDDAVSMCTLTPPATMNGSLMPFTAATIAPSAFTSLNAEVFDVLVLENLSGSTTRVGVPAATFPGTLGCGGGPTSATLRILAIPPSSGCATSVQVTFTPRSGTNNPLIIIQ